MIFTQSAEIEKWLTAPLPEALALQRPLPDGALEIVATGAKEDGAKESPALADAAPRLL